MRDRSSTYQALRAQTGSFYEIEVLQGNRTYGLGDLFELKISPKLFDGSGPSIGNTYSTVCEMTLREESANWPRMASFSVHMRLCSADGETKSEWLSMGTYYTDERVQNVGSGKLTITGYDRMLQTEQFWTDVVPEEDLPENWPITAKAWLDMIEDAGLVTQDSRNDIDDTVAFIGLNTASTVRDVLQTIASAHGGNWIFTPDDKLRLVPLANGRSKGSAVAGIAIAGIAVVGMDHDDEIGVPEGIGIQNLQMNVQRLDRSPHLAAVTGVRLETENGTVISAGTTAGYVLQAKCNFSSSEGVAGLCLSRTHGYVYMPFTAEKALLDPAAEIGDIVVIDDNGYQMDEIEWNLNPRPTAQIAAAFEEEVNHEYNYLDESAKNYRKSVKYTDGKADELQDEITAAETAIEQTAEAVALTAQAVGAERVTQSLNLLHYPLSEEQIVTVSGLTFTYNYDGSVAVDGTATASVYTGFAGETAVDSGTYTFSVETPPDFGPASSYTVPLLVKVGSTAYNLETVTERDGKKIYSTSRSASGGIGFVLAVNSGETVHAVLYPQIASGSALQDWQPPVGAAVSDRLNQLQASLRVTAQGIYTEVSRATAAEASLISDVDVEYIKWDYPDDGVAAHVPPKNDPNWSTDSPGWETGKYIWQRTKTTAGGGSTTTSNPTCIQGAAATAYSLQVSHAVILDEGGGSYDPASITLSAKQQSGSASMTSYAGRFKIETTADGSSWTSRYTSSSNESSKSYTIPTNITFTAIRCSLYAAGGTSTLLDQEILPLISEGAQGEDGYTVVLTNSNHTFAGNETAAISGQSAECYVIAYKGTTQMAVNIGTITGMPTGMPTPTISGNNTVNAKFTVSVTASMTTKSGVLTVPVTVDGKSFSMKFSYSLALAGETGDDGISPTKIEEQYIKTTSSQNVPSENDPNWSNQQPVWESGKYIWTRSEITWSDSTAQNPHITHTTPVLAKAINGANEQAYNTNQNLITNYSTTTQTESLISSEVNGMLQGPIATESDNLCPYPLAVTSDNSNMTITDNGDGTYTVLKTAASAEWDMAASCDLPAGTYTFTLVEEADSLSTNTGYLKLTVGGSDTSWITMPRTTSGGKNYYTRAGYTASGRITKIFVSTTSRGSQYAPVGHRARMYVIVNTGSETIPWQTPVGARMSLQAAYSTIQQTAEGIIQKVGKGEVISSINQSAEGLTIDARMVNLNSYVTITSLGASGSTTVNGNRISGGTLTLGGSGNGNGVLKIKNASGTDIVVGDKDGLRVTDGIINGGTIDGASIIGTTIEFRGSVYGSKLRMYSYSQTGSTSIYRIDASYSGYGILGIYANAGVTGYAGFSVDADGGIYLKGDNYSITINSNGIDFNKDGYGSIDHWG